MLAKVVTAYVTVVMRWDRPQREGETVLMRKDNVSEVQRVMKSKSTESTRDGNLTRLMGVLRDDTVSSFRHGML